MNEEQMKRRGIGNAMATLREAKSPVRVSGHVRTEEGEGRRRTMVLKMEMMAQ